MDEAHRTTVAGLGSGVVVLTAWGGGLALAPWQWFAGASFLLVATLALSRARFRPWAVLCTWLAAVVLIACLEAPLGAVRPGEAALALVVGVLHASLTVGPWLLATAVVRHLLTPPATDPRSGDQAADPRPPDVASTTRRA